MKPIQKSDKPTVIERNIFVNGTHIRVKSVFNGDIPLEKALANIAKRKLAGTGKNGKSD